VRIGVYLIRESLIQVRALGEDFEMQSNVTAAIKLGRLCIVRSF